MQSKRMGRAFLALLVTACVCFDMFLGRVYATTLPEQPEVCRVIFSKVEFKNSAGTYVVFAKGRLCADILRSDPRTLTTTIRATQPVPPDAYTAIRITFLRMYGVKWSFWDPDTGHYCYTSSPNDNSLINTADFTKAHPVSCISNALYADESLVTEQRIALPYGEKISLELKRLGVKELFNQTGDKLRIEKPACFFVCGYGPVPCVKINCAQLARVFLGEVVNVEDGTPVRVLFPYLPSLEARIEWGDR